MENIANAYRIMLWIGVVFLSVSILACLMRAIAGPRFTDRIVSINVICTKTVIVIAILSCLFNSSSLLDIAVIFAMIGFLAVVVLSKCYLLPFHNDQEKQEAVHDSDGFIPEPAEGGMME